MAHFQTHPYNKRTVLKWGIRHHGAAPVQWLTLKITLGVPLEETSIILILVGGDLTNHLEKYESQWEGLSHILWKIKNV